MTPYGAGGRNAFGRLDGVAERILDRLGYDIEVINFEEKPDPDERRGRSIQTVMDPELSGIVDGQVRRSSLPRTTTTESGLSVDYDSQIFILDGGPYPVYGSDDANAVAATQFIAVDEPSPKRYQTLDYRSQQNGLLEIDVEEIAYQPTGRERD